MGSLLIFKAQPMLSEQRFKGSVNRLAKELEWSHKVALSASADIDFIIKKKGETLFCQRMTDEPFEFGGGNHRFKIEHIPHFYFEGEEAKELKITFTRSGWMNPEGKIKLDSSGKSYEISLNPGENQRILAKET